MQYLPVLLFRIFFLQDGFPAIITINKNHNHAANVAESLSFLRPIKETRQIFEGYFDDGMGIKEAINFHESKLELEFPLSSVELANASINPKYRTIQFWHDVWRNRNLGPRFGKGIIEVHRYLIRILPNNSRYLLNCDMLKKQCFSYTYLFFFNLQALKNKNRIVCLK